jgi:hypothetical protein
MLKEEPQKDYRASVERELETRLAAGAAAPEARQHPAASEDELPGGVRLLCLRCRSLCEADAQFCSHCGTRFNAIMVGAVRANGRR